jgi:iron complex outermembrane receptor protein
MVKVSFWLSASALALAFCSPAAAQPASTQPTDTSSAQPTDQTNSGEVIVVTAQRRRENLQTTPISASVISGTELSNRNIVSVDQLQFAMPSVTIDNFGQGLEFNIRGIGKAEHNTQTTTGVITYRDGVATFPGYVQEEPYFDVASIEVLRGPQGTIAGQNATGGAVFVTTNDPQINGGSHGYIQGQFGNYTDAGLQGALNIPVSDTFAARLAFYTERRDGFYHITGPAGSRYTGHNGDLDEAAVRLSLLWRPTSRLTITSKTDADYIDMGGYPADPYYDRFSVLPGTTGPNPYRTDLFHITANSPQGARDKFIREILRIEYDLGGGTMFRSVSGVQVANTNYRADLDGRADVAIIPTLPAFGTPGANATFFDTVNERILSQEFNIVSPDNRRFTYLLGAYAQWNRYHFLEPFQFIINTPPPGAGIYVLQGINPERSLAVFGQFGFRLTPRLKLEVGGRYTESRTRNDVQVNQFGLPIDDQETANFHNFSWKASLGWEVNQQNYIYAFRATGFRPGGLNVPVGFGLATPPFGSEHVTSYELGWRANFMGGHIRTTVNGFYNDYRNFQVIVGYPTFPTFGIELNVPNTTHIYGGEAQIEAHLGHFYFDVGASYVHSRLGGFFATDARVASFTPCNIVTGPASPSCINLDGREQTYAPNFSFNAAAAYDIVLSPHDTLTPRVNYGHVAAQWATLFENPNFGDRLAARNIWGAQLAWAHGPWTVTAYTTNFTDQHYVGALISGLDVAGPPRQYGVRVLRLF